MTPDEFGDYTIYSGHEGSGRCWWCGGEFPDKRHRRYCSESCNHAYWGHYAWSFAVPAAIRRASHKCANCGGHDYWRLWDKDRTHEQWLAWQQEVVSLEVHHIIRLEPDEPRMFNAKNQPDNLIVLCKSCHVEVHKVMRLDVKERHADYGRQLVFETP